VRFFGRFLYGLYVCRCASQCYLSSALVTLTLTALSATRCCLPVEQGATASSMAGDVKDNKDLSEDQPPVKGAKCDGHTGTASLPDCNTQREVEANAGQVKTAGGALECDEQLTADAGGALYSEQLVANDGGTCDSNEQPVVMDAGDALDSSQLVEIARGASDYEQLAISAGIPQCGGVVARLGGEEGQGQQGSSLGSLTALTGGRLPKGTQQAADNSGKRAWQLPLVMVCLILLLLVWLLLTWRQQQQY